MMKTKTRGRTEGDEAEAPGFARLALGDNHRLFDRAELAEVRLEVIYTREEHARGGAEHKTTWAIAQGCTRVRSTFAHTRRTREHEAQTHTLRRGRSNWAAGMHMRISARSSFAHGGGAGVGGATGLGMHIGARSSFAHTGRLDE